MPRHGGLPGVASWLPLMIAGRWSRDRRLGTGKVAHVVDPTRPERQLRLASLMHDFDGETVLFEFRELNADAAQFVRWRFHGSHQSPSDFADNAAVVSRPAVRTGQGRRSILLIDVSVPKKLWRINGSVRVPCHNV